MQGRSGHPLWGTRARRVALSTEITHEHVSASAAIPIVFPPVRIRTSAGGGRFFGDGALQKAELPTSEPQDAGGPEPTQPPMAQICGVESEEFLLGGDALCPSTSRSITSRTTATTGSSPLAAGRAAASGAALPHAHPFLFAEGRAGRAFINWQQDPQANYLARLVFPGQTRELRIEVDLVAEMAVLNPFDFFLEPHAEKFPFAYEPARDSASSRRTS